MLNYLYNRLMWVTKDADKPRVKWSPVLAPVIRKKDVRVVSLYYYVIKHCPAIV